MEQSQFRGKRPAEIISDSQTPFIASETLVQKRLRMGQCCASEKCKQQISPREMVKFITDGDKPYGWTLVANGNVAIGWMCRTCLAMAAAAQERCRRNEPCPCGSGRKFKRCCKI